MFRFETCISNSPHDKQLMRLQQLQLTIDVTSHSNSLTLPTVLDTVDALAAGPYDDSRKFQTSKTSPTFFLSQNFIFCVPRFTHSSNYV